MKKLFFILLILPYLSWTQSIERELVSTAGEVQTISGSAIVSWSIGEPVVDQFFFGNHVTSGFQQGEKSAALPVDLLAFDAKRLDVNHVDLKWKAIWTGNFEGFWIERKLEGEEDFQEIAFIAKKEGEELENYFYQDDNAHFDHSYYRLKMVEVDKSVEYSSIKVVEGTPLLHQTTIYPNPFEDVFYINIQPDERQIPTIITIHILDNNGRLIEKSEMSFNYKVFINALKEETNSLYFIKIELDGKPLEILKLLKKG